MRHVIIVLAAAGLPLMTGGCLSTAASIVTAPVRAAGKVVDWSTTSQSEADRNYGKKKRLEEEREGRERKAHDKTCKKDPANCGEYTGYRAGDPEPND